MTVEDSQQHSSSRQTNLSDNEINNTIEAAGDSLRRRKNKLLADETSRLLCGDSSTLLDDILSHPLSNDYFNVYLSLPIFGQRVLCHRTSHQFEFDPPLSPRRQASDQLNEEAKQWLTHCRLNNYIQTDIYIESLLGLLLLQSDESSSKLPESINAKKPKTNEHSQVFSTVTDVRQFHQFLQSTSGIKYWDFFIDSMRILRSRYASRSNRIDISHSNFIYKYYSRQQEFRSIQIDEDQFRMPDSSTSDTVWFQMAINAMQQLRTYWLPRYFSQLSFKPQLIVNQINHHSLSSSENVIASPSTHSSPMDSTTNDFKLTKFTLDNISYVDYNPRRQILIQPSKSHDFQQNIEEEEEEVNKSNHHQTTSDSRIPFEYPLSNRSIEDYATDANIELFYRILVSDSLAGCPFFEHISQALPKIESTPLQTCLRFLTDAEVILSTTSGDFRDRICKQFISRYVTVTTPNQLPDQILTYLSEQRTELIKELLIENDDQYSFLWNTLLKITKHLIPYFLNYIKFDRLRFLVQGKSLNIRSTIDDLRGLSPSINFDTLLIDPQIKFNETNLLVRSNTKYCDEQATDLLTTSLFKSHYYTTEKLINTDEQCQFSPGQRFPPLSEDELNQELRHLCTKSEWKDTKTIYDTPISSLQTSDSVKLSSIELFTDELLNSARDIFEIDRYISNLMNESLHLFQTNESSKAANTDLDSSSQSSIPEEMLRIDSSPITTTIFPQLITSDRNQSALISLDSSTPSSRKPIETKFFSLIGSYFINLPNRTSQLENPSIHHSIDPVIYSYLQDNHTKPINEFSLHEQFNSLSSSFHGLIKELTIDNIGVGHLFIDLLTTNIPFNDEDILKLNPKIKLYTDYHREFLLADIKSYTMDSNKHELQLHLHDFQLPHNPNQSPMNIKRIYDKDSFFHESIYYTPKDKCNEVNTIVHEKRMIYFQHDDQQQLLTFIRNEINHDQWPLQEYIGMKGQRAWRALKLASDISNFDSGFMSHYHHQIDWISTEHDLGSFGERTYLIIRNCQRRRE